MKNVRRIPEPSSGELTSLIQTQERRASSSPAFVCSSAAFRHSTAPRRLGIRSCISHQHTTSRPTPTTSAAESSQDYYKLLEIDYDASDEDIRLNYRRLALKWHPDKFKGDSDVTSKFQEINEAYRVLSDPTKRHEYDSSGNYEIDKCTLREYLARFKGMILTCNGLGMNHTPIWGRRP